MVHFSPTRLPPGEMERRDPVRAEVPPALPVLVPGLAHFLVVGLTDLSCQPGSHLPLPPSVHRHHVGLESVGCTPQCGERSQWDAHLWRALPVGCTPQCGKLSQPRWGLTAFHFLRRQLWERLPGQPCVISARS